MLMHDKNSSTFNPAVFLARAGLGRGIVELNAGENFFTQGDQLATQEILAEMICTMLSRVPVRRTAPCAALSYSRLNNCTAQSPPRASLRATGKLASLSTSK